MVGISDLATQLLGFLWSTLQLLAPMLLLGLLLAGVIHVLISRAAVLRWLSADSLKAVCLSSAAGVPIPLCSCSVVPVVAEMRNKGASRSACMSFLITAPETGADSILVTHAFFGFVAAVVRPLISFTTAVVTGALCIALGTGRQSRGDSHGGHRDHDHACGHDRGRCSHHGESHAGHSAHRPLMQGSEDCYVSPAQLKAIVLAWLSRLAGRAKRGRTSSLGDGERDAALTARRERVPTLGQVVRHVLRYGFVEVADDILFAMVVGVAAGGLLFLSIPDGLMAGEAVRWASYPVMLLVGVPLYICASASTPIAAALVAKGLTPGAALIFLMTGPATNSGTIAIIVSQFGSRFAAIYVAGVTAVSLAAGIAIDAFVALLGFTLPVSLSGSELPAVQAVESVAALALIGLIAWRFRNGALRRGLHDMLSNISGILRLGR